MAAAQQQMQAGKMGQQAGSSGSDAVNADIQQLLKEVSGELKQLEAKLTPEQAAQIQTPGTGTDTGLYSDTRESLEQAANTRAAPLPLKVDDQATASSRQGGGIGEASGDAADDAPQQARQSAELSDRSEDGSAGTRERVPPEYRPVFERLNKRPSQP